MPKTPPPSSVRAPGSSLPFPGSDVALDKEACIDSGEGEDGKDGGLIEGLFCTEGAQGPSEGMDSLLASASRSEDEDSSTGHKRSLSQGSGLIPKRRSSSR